METGHKSARILGRAIATGALLLCAFPHTARCQITPEQVAELRNVIGDRIEALTILGGDFGLAGGTFRSTGKFQFAQNTSASLSVSKLGGAGDIGDPQPVFGLNVGWQPSLQGNMGATHASTTVQSGQLAGDVSKLDAKGIEFGGGARFWLTDRFSVAPSIMGLYGRSTESYTANSAFMRANLPAAEQLGLVNWSVDTVTVVTGAGFQYILNWNRTLITLTSTPTFFDTESVKSSNANVYVKGTSGILANEVDVDIPLGIEFLHHELRTGGYFLRSDLYGGLKTGLNEDYIYEAHGRIVLDFLNQLWKVKYLGIGASYLWGPNITGWTAGIDAVFRF
ncbi:MAG TPA: hypothetical protein VMG11_12495 [Steroidobacteraceae bacterium]|nr:hypothetical protein [Steroidobacteraceae bacterium]